MGTAMVEMKKYLKTLLLQLHIREIINQFHCRIFVILPALFVTGLVFSYSFVEYTVTSVLIDYITESQTTISLSNAAMIVNFLDGVSCFMAFVLAHLSDANYISRLTIVAMSTLVYLIGLVMLWISTSLVILDYRIKIFYAAALLVALGLAAGEPCLRAFLADQISLLAPNSNTHKEWVEARTNFLWYTARFIASVVSFMYNFLTDYWARRFRISAILMGACYLVFWAGFFIYNRRIPYGSFLSLIYNVVKAAILKRKLQYPQMASQFFKNDNDQLPLPPQISILRRLDKAAIMESLYPEDEVKEGKLSTVNEVILVKILFKMVPMWTTFLVYSVVQSAGSTFFFAQTNNLNDYINGSFHVPLNALIIIKSVSSYSLSYTCDYFLSNKENIYTCGFLRSVSKKKLSDAKRKNCTLVRIFLGMTCSLCCCITAALVEKRRLRLVYTLPDDPDMQGTIAMSILYLAPQFILLGAMEGLAEGGIDDLLCDQIASSMDRYVGPYGPPFQYFVLCIGKFVGILGIHLCGGFFGDTINTSRLDKYYILLTIIVSCQLLLIFLFSLVIYADYGKEARRGHFEVEEG